jgi:biotin transporter BioY
MATVDFATPLLGDFSTQLEIAFGPTFGWLVGHLIILGIIAILIQSLRNTSLLTKNLEISSNKIKNFVGYGIAFLIQYQLFVTFSFPISGAIITAISSTLLWKWTFDVLTPTNV